MSKNKQKLFEMMSKIDSSFKRPINEAVDLNVVRKQIEQYYSKFKELENKLNQHSTDELINNYIFSEVFDEVTKLKESFNNIDTAFYNDFNQIGDDTPEESTIYDEYSEVDNELGKFKNLVDNFYDDLETMKSAFDMLGDLSRGTRYFNPR
jgi:archaellum component FlaC